VIAVIGAITLTRQPVFLAWPFVAAALIFGLFAWWLYDDNRAERSLLNAAACALFPRRRSGPGLAKPIGWPIPRQMEAAPGVTTSPSPSNGNQR
jgi:hypothetical protein